MSTTRTNTILKSLQPTLENLIGEFDRIPEQRKELIKELTGYVGGRIKSGQMIFLNFICTHNSRRSHISQVWAQTAAHYYRVEQVKTFSGGTEATAFNPRAVAAMKEVGFEISTVKDGNNPVYEVKFSDDAPSLSVFSKKYDDDFNPDNDFAAIMTCSHADENCPLIPGASARIALTYDDPKDFDGTPQEAEKYLERVREIGREMLYAFSKVNGW